MTGIRQQKGLQGEILAADYLERRGLKVVARNFRCPLGEIDLVARDGETVVFVEVKSRSGLGYGLPQEAVSRGKQRRLTRLAQWYLGKNGMERLPARFDVVAVSWRGGSAEVTWIVNAFEATE